MKKSFKFIASIASITLLLFCFAGCASSPEYVLPTVVSESNGYSMEHVNNIERDYELGGSHKLNHADYENSSNIQYAWLIKKDSVKIGWIYISGAYSVDNKDKSKYSYGITVRDSKHFYETTDITVYLIGSTEAYMTDNVTVKVSCGAVERTGVSNDEQEGFAVAHYGYDLSRVDPRENKEITVTVNFAA